MVAAAVFRVAVSLAAVLSAGAGIAAEVIWRDQARNYADAEGAALPYRRVSLVFTQNSATNDFTPGCGGRSLPRWPHCPIRLRRASCSLRAGSRTRLQREGPDRPSAPVRASGGNPSSSGPRGSADCDIHAAP